MNQARIQENISQNLLRIIKHPNIQVTSSNKGPLNWNGKSIFSMIWKLLWLLLHGANILTCYYINLYLNKRSIFSIKELHIKVNKWEKLF